jgi:hypothetical protein
MPKPCGHTLDETKPDCYLCGLAARNPAYAAMFARPEKRAQLAGWRQRLSLECHYRGEVLEQQVCKTCNRKEEVAIHDCAMHGRCTKTFLIPGIKVCLLCTDRPIKDVGKPLPPAPAVEICPGLADPIREPPVSPAPVGWASQPAVRDLHQSALRHLAAAELPILDGVGDGMVICGGGRYWAGAVVAVRMLRRFSDLPVQIWYRGEAEPIETADLEGVKNVRLIDATKYPHRVLGGWEVKTLALLHCGLERVIFLDADAYPVADPCTLFNEVNEDVAFAFWVDLPNNALTVQWEWTGLVGANGVPPVQGGQLVLHRPGFSRGLLLAHWINQHSDYFYHHQYGDQDSWRIALAATERPYRVIGPADWGDTAFVCSRGEGADRSAVVVHRCGSKMFRDQMPSPKHSLPYEKEAFEYFHQPRGGGATEVFDRIYTHNGWRHPGTTSPSGAGSTAPEAAPYLDLVNGILAVARPTCVVDLGAGDGYITTRLGPCPDSGTPGPALFAVDCHAPLIASLKSKYPRIFWQCLDLDGDRDRLPGGYLALLKDVLHHFPNGLVDDWLTWAAKSGKWRYLILTYDRLTSGDVKDAALGSWRPLSWDRYPLARPGLRRLGSYDAKEVAILDATLTTAGS